MIGRGGWAIPLVDLWNRIEPTLGKGVASQNPFGCQPNTTGHAERFDARNSVFTARWPKSTTSEKMEAKVGLVESNKEDRKPSCFTTWGDMGLISQVARARSCTVIYRRNFAAWLGAFRTAFHDGFSPER